MHFIEGKLPDFTVELALLEDTNEYANQLASHLKPGSVVCLVGDLGAGKTTMTQMICAALKVDDYVTSPSFNIMNTYEGELSGTPIDIYHFDVYRIGSPDEMDEIGFDEFLYGKGICIVEWATLVEAAIPSHAIWIELKMTETFTREMRIFGLDLKKEKR